MMIVAMTGFGRYEDRRETREAGFDHHLVKPVDPVVVERLLTAGKPVPDPGAS
jgi:CheY-like chemotaxis protein